MSSTTPDAKERKVESKRTKTRSLKAHYKKTVGGSLKFKGGEVLKKGALIKKKKRKHKELQRRMHELKQRGQLPRDGDDQRASERVLAEMASRPTIRPNWNNHSLELIYAGKKLNRGKASSSLDRRVKKKADRYCK